MGGYMGFGMQQWIYTRIPKKKMYKRERIPSFTPLDKYSRTFAIKPSVKENKTLRGLITLCFISFTIVVLIVYLPKFTAYSNGHTQSVHEALKKQNITAFNFLINSGKNRLRTNRVLEAYKEFKLAYAINSNNDELQILLTQTLSILCEKDLKYCNELEVFLNEFN